MYFKNVVPHPTTFFIWAKTTKTEQSTNNNDKTKQNTTKT